jgi:hypothetical protein
MHSPILSPPTYLPTHLPMDGFSQLPITLITYLPTYLPDKIPTDLLLSCIVFLALVVLALLLLACTNLSLAIAVWTSLHFQSQIS